MIIEIKLFAVARQLADAETVSLEVPAGASLAEVRTALADRVPELADLAAQVRFAVNAAYADDATPIREGDEVAMIPPVSGG
ncbi:MAG: molybdopterin converting factor subunit 1 [Planctomycetota bacterium]|nr:MAG: molybdopterin converting factor subunit 1 [Planctomycetota bacterium]REJ95662.1 MAG: molybdopterin converting factor subunit 1 [Planctomycetota bacterium]REK29173.1 MAG: molybdopterin converting factor subunit 1 [Planctomycetota bacterium]REK46963.1 MAG: molybdopterin converting factor subunit 1 [Planctomycetota bacterium]